jgi:hypothetical protein
VGFGAASEGLRLGVIYAQWRRAAPRPAVVTGRWMMPMPGAELDGAAIGGAAPRVVMLWPEEPEFEQRRLCLQHRSGHRGRA